MSLLSWLRRKHIERLRVKFARETARARILQEAAEKTGNGYYIDRFVESQANAFAIREKMRLLGVDDIGKSCGVVR